MFRNRDIKLIINSYKIYIQCIHIQKKISLEHYHNILKSTLH